MMWLILVLMAVTTFAFRYLFFSGYLRFEAGPRLERFLSFSAPAVLTAMAAPIVVAPAGELALTMTSPYLIGGLTAVVLSRLSRSLLLVVVVSLAVFTLTQSLAGAG